MPWGKSHRYSSRPSHPLILRCQWPRWWSKALHFYTLKDAQHVSPSGVIQWCILLHYHFKMQNYLSGLYWEPVLQHSHTHSNKGYCLLTHRLSLNETGAICRFINYTLSHTTSLSAEQREGERGLPFLLYINVRLQPSWLQPASPAHSVCPRDMPLIIMKWGVKKKKKVALMSVCIHCHLKLYARLMAVKLKGLALNFLWSSHVPVPSSWFHVSSVRGKLETSFKMLSISSRQPNVPLQLVQRVILDLSHHPGIVLALMSNWNISCCLPWNVILCCTLGTLEDKTLCSKAEGKWGRIAFPTFHKHKLMSHWELASKHQPPCFMFVLRSSVCSFNCSRKCLFCISN